jgi:hypothetical protein
MPRLPPWWPGPLAQWARELREHGAGVGLEKWMRDHPDEVAAFMKGFLRSDAPRVQPWAETVYRLRPKERLRAEAKRRRAIIDDLPIERRRLICAAGRLLWRGAAAARRTNAEDVAQAIIEEMRDLFGSPRLKSVRALTLTFTGERLSMRAMRRIADPSGTAIFP